LGRSFVKIGKPAEHERLKIQRLILQSGGAVFDYLIVFLLVPELGNPFSPLTFPFRQFPLAYDTASIDGRCRDKSDGQEDRQEQNDPPSSPSLCRTKIFGRKHHGQ
jgi:hypothetical protein